MPVKINNLLKIIILIIVGLIIYSLVGIHEISENNIGLDEANLLVFEGSIFHVENHYLHLEVSEYAYEQTPERLNNFFKRDQRFLESLWGFQAHLNRADSRYIYPGGKEEFNKISEDIYDFRRLYIGVIAASQNLVMPSIDEYDIINYGDVFKSILTNWISLNDNNDNNINITDEKIIAQVLYKYSPEFKNNFVEVLDSFWVVKLEWTDIILSYSLYDFSNSVNNQQYDELNNNLLLEFQEKENFIEETIINGRILNWIHSQNEFASELAEKQNASILKLKYCLLILIVLIVLLGLLIHYKLAKDHELVVKNKS